MGHKILHRKQKHKQSATKYYTENKNINIGPQNTTQKTKNINNGIFVFCVVFCGPLFIFLFSV
jgi:hypothetical protein